MLHGRAGAEGRQGSGRLPPRHAWKQAALFSPRSISRRKNPVGASRCRRASGAASACSRRSPASSRPWWKRKSTNRARCICAASPRAVDTGIAVNPDTDHGAARRRADLRPDRRALWRDHHRQGTRPAIQLQRLPHAAHRSGAEDRGSRHQERRGARRHRRDRRDGGAAGAAQRDLCRDRRRLAAAADRPRR